jgi:peroxiredoxin
LPGFINNTQSFKDKGVDSVACVSVNDPFVMGAWGKDRGVGEDVLMLSDGNGEFTAAIGLEMDGSGFGLGTRSQRYAMIVDDGVVSTLNVESGPGLDVSSAETILSKL